jgi:hypothetical protein
MKQMKTIKHVLAILVLFLGIFLIVNMKRDEPAPVVAPVVVPAVPDTVPVSSIPTTGTQCFYRISEATASGPYRIEEHIVLDFTGQKVSGLKSGTQAGPDMNNGFEGTLLGSTIDDEIELVFAYTIEGSKNRELEVYTFDGDKLIKKRWALKEEKINGINILVPDYIGDPILISYTPEGCANQD